MLEITSNFITPNKSIASKMSHESVVWIRRSLNMYSCVSKRTLHCSFFFFLFSPVCCLCAFPSQLICTFNTIIKKCLCMRARLLFLHLTVFRYYVIETNSVGCLLFQAQNDHIVEMKSGILLTLQQIQCAHLLDFVYFLVKSWIFFLQFIQDFARSSLKQILFSMIVFRTKMFVINSRERKRKH